jgi:hypothetical protein
VGRILRHPVTRDMELTFELLEEELPAEVAAAAGSPGE